MEKAEFRNTSRGHCGVVVIEPGQKPRGISVPPNESIWLTEEEQIETANAPRKAEDNPFVNGTLTLVTEPKDLANRRPIGHTTGNQPTLSESDQAKADAKKAEEEAAKEQMARDEEARTKAAQEAQEAAAAKAPKPLPHQQEQGLEVEPTGPPPEGERAVKEEVATPEAEKAATPKPKPVPAKAG